MKERPILFSAPMVRAILAGKKTQTRRIVKCPDATTAWVINPERDGKWWPTDGDDYVGGGIACPYGAPGDRLWVREAFVYRAKYDEFYYRADHPVHDPYAHDGWKPSIHMPRRATRITLEVTGVRVERLQDISEADAQTEGVVGPHFGRWTDLDGKPTPPESAPARPWAHSFFVAWSEINGRDSLWANPWVWVVEFRRVEAQERAA